MQAVISSLLHLMTGLWVKFFKPPVQTCLLRHGQDCEKMYRDWRDTEDKRTGSVTESQPGFCQRHVYLQFLHARNVLHRHGVLEKKQTWVTVACLTGGKRQGSCWQWNGQGRCRTFSINIGMSAPAIFCQSSLVKTGVNAGSIKARWGKSTGTWKT